MLPPRYHNTERKKLQHSLYERDLTNSLGSFNDGNSLMNPLQRKRFINQKSICAEGVPKQYGTKSILGSKSFFGRYGDIISMNIDDKVIDGNTDVVKVYVNFGQELPCALAFLGAHKITHKFGQITVCYGANRYCQQFIKNRQCKKRNCYYLHSIDDQNDTQKPQNKRESHFDKACSTIVANLFDAINMQKEEKKKAAISGSYLRTIGGVLARMILIKKLSSEVYEKTKMGRIISLKIVTLKKDQNTDQAVENLSTSSEQDSSKSGKSDLNKVQITSFSKSKTQEQSKRDEQINNMIVAKILKNLKGKKTFSRLLPFTQSDESGLEKFYYRRSEVERNNVVRQKIVEKLMEN